MLLWYQTRRRVIALLVRTLYKRTVVRGCFNKGRLQYRRDVCKYPTYADGIVLMAPLWRGLQHLLDVDVLHSKAIHMSLNACKSVFHPRDRRKVISCSFPQLLSVLNVNLQYVPRFKYVGHIIDNSNADDADIQRKVSNLCTY